MVDLPDTIASLASSHGLSVSMSGLVRSWRACLRGPAVQPRISASIA
jgi:hypothetical protein